MLDVALGFRRCKDFNHHPSGVSRGNCAVSRAKRSRQRLLKDIEGWTQKFLPLLRFFAAPLRRDNHGLPSGYVNSLLLNMAIEIVDLKW